MATEAEKVMSCLLDQAIINQLDELNRNNKPIPAAIINAVTRRLSTQGIADSPASPKSKTAEIIKRVRAAGYEPDIAGRIPVVDTESDDAATA